MDSGKGFYFVVPFFLPWFVFGFYDYLIFFFFPMWSGCDKKRPEAIRSRWCPLCRLTGKNVWRTRRSSKTVSSVWGRKSRHSQAVSLGIIAWSCPFLFVLVFYFLSFCSVGLLGFFFFSPFLSQSFHINLVCKSSTTGPLDPLHGARIR